MFAESLEEGVISLNAHQKNISSCNSWPTVISASELQNQSLVYTSGTSCLSYRT